MFKIGDRVRLKPEGAGRWVGIARRAKGIGTVVGICKKKWLRDSVRVMWDGYSPKYREAFQTKYLENLGDGELG